MRTLRPNFIFLLLTEMAVYLCLACTDRRIFVATEGHALYGHVISSHQVTSHRDCHILCIEHKRCLSYNYQYLSPSSSQLCELKDATGKMCPHNMTQVIGFKYYEDYNASCDRICPRGDTNLTDFQLTFPSKAVTNYVSLDIQSCAAPLTAFTVCLWSKSANISDGGCLFSYSVPEVANEILICDYIESFMFLIKNDRSDIDVPHSADVLLHICVSWENAAGSWKFYVNGSLLQSGDDFLIDEVIPTNGIVILGQDQDDYGGGFEQDQSFLGQIYGVNMWNRDLTDDEIYRLAKNCSHGVGHFMSWSDFSSGLNGNVSLTSPITCNP